MMYPYWSALKNNEMGVAEKLNKVKKYVASNTLKKADWENSTIISCDVLKEVSKIKNEGKGNILVQGSAELVHALLAAGLVDELRLLINPYIIGSGQRLFPNEVNKELEFVDSKRLEKGVMAAYYKPLK